MISTSRGLSAVRPGDDRDADVGGLWHGALRQPPAELAGGFAGDAGPGRQGVLGDAVLANPGHTVRGRQRSADVDDSDSTATTSVLTV